MATKWGIVSAGKISHDFVQALKLKPNDHQVVAVAARSLKDAQKFAATHGIKIAYEGYEELSKDPNIDVVYIGTIIIHHFSVSSMMLKAGKNVLCEKSLCMNAEETRKLVDLAKEKNVFLMEAIWSRCFPAYEQIKERVDSKEIGELVQVNASLGLKLSHVTRLTKKDLGGSVIQDLGIYPIQFALHLFGEKPSKIVALGHLGPEGCDESMSVVMTFPKSGTALLSSHSRCDFFNDGFVIGTEGTIKVPNFWCPFGYETPTTKVDLSFDCNESNFNFINATGLIYEADEVRRCLQLGLKESPSIPHKESILIAEIMQEILRQIVDSHA